MGGWVISSMDKALNLITKIPGFLDRYNLHTYAILSYLIGMLPTSAFSSKSASPTLGIRFKGRKLSKHQTWDISIATIRTNFIITHFATLIAAKFVQMYT